MRSGPVIPIVPVPVHAPVEATDSVAMVSLFQSEAKIYPRAVKGWFARWRWIMVALTQAVFYGLPWLQWNGRQSVLFDLDGRHFQVFGLVLVPQDFIYLAALLVIAALGLFFFTAVAGRLWCGYACPQTVYTEIFLWIERQTEGDRIARMRLDQAPWSARKLGRKGAKHAGWLALSAVTGITFVGYFTPLRGLVRELAALDVGGWSLFWIAFYGLATYGNAGFLREQVCKYMCPYARFQSTLLDRDSMVIAYDTRRGDPRGSRSRKADPRAQGLGDCIDCTLCVQVCPTGIDIRDGLQNECIGCAACIDVCDDVMLKMDYPLGLIRYATENGVDQGLTRREMQRRVLRPRVLVYGALLGLAALAFVASLALRSHFTLDVLKDRNGLARVVEEGRIENVYTLQVTNGSEQARRLRVEVSGVPGLLIATATELQVAGLQMATLPVRLALSPAQARGFEGRSTPIVFRLVPLEADAGPAVTEKSTFYVPR